MTEYAKLQKKYEDLGLNDLKVRDVEDIEKIYNIYPLQVKGYGNLTPEQQKHYKKFIINFYNRQGLEAREDIKLISVKYIPNENYIKVSFEKDWYHLLPNGDWY